MKHTNQEQWQRLNYYDEDSETAFDSYGERLFFPDVAAAPVLRSCLDKDEFLDAISAPSSSKGMKRTATNKRGTDDLIEISDLSDEEEGDAPL